MEIEISDTFARELFWQTWERIPQKDRVFFENRLHVTDAQYHQKRGNKHFGADDRTLALCTPAPTGVRICIYSDRVAKYDADIVQAVIAHELAHVLLGHVVSERDAPKADSVDEDTAECEADEQAEMWGFKSARAEVYWKPIYESSEFQEMIASLTKG